MLGLGAKWFHNVCLANASIVLILVALLWAIAAAFLTVREIK